MLRGDLEGAGPRAVRRGARADHDARQGASSWARGNSLFPATFGLACCAIEMMSIVAARYDIARFGSEVFRASPRQADLLILSGRVSIKMAPVVRRIYDQMLEPKWVISMGACSSSVGVFNNYAVVQGADKFMPVDVHVPGCPPRPEALMLRDPQAAADDPRRPRPRLARALRRAYGTEEAARPARPGPATGRRDRPRRRRDEAPDGLPERRRRRRARGAATPAGTSNA